ncbi:MAG: hypothetical protein JST31_11510 [Actinobacteria bacterium]|nr:hypothetical protein [Actinomycetota bacterium]
MFYCERCGSRFNETVAGASSTCPRCRDRDGVESTLRFRLFSRSALKVAGIEPQRTSRRPTENRG